jgi:hypothetical protein
VHVIGKSLKYRRWRMYLHPKLTGHRTRAALPRDRVSPRPLPTHDASPFILCSSSRPCSALDHQISRLYHDVLPWKVDVLGGDASVRACPSSRSRGLRPTCRAIWLGARGAQDRHTAFSALRGDSLLTDESQKFLEPDEGMSTQAVYEVRPPAPGTRIQHVPTSTVRVHTTCRLRRGRVRLFFVSAANLTSRPSL